MEHFDQSEIEERIRAAEPILPAWRLFPVVGKRPARGMSWTERASEDPADRAAMAETFSHDGWAVACGPSRLVVVDLDVHEANGIESWSAFLADAGIDEPDGNPHVIGSTPSGGRHLYFARHGDVGNRVGVLPGVDVRGVGGYAVFAGPGRRLTILDWAFPPAPRPLLDLLAPTRRAVLASPDRRPHGRADRDALTTRLLNAADRVVATPPGSRNDALNRAAYTEGRAVIAAGGDADGVLDMLVNAGVRAGLSEREARATVESGLGVRT